MDLYQQKCSENTQKSPSSSEMTLWQMKDKETEICCSPILERTLMVVTMQFSPEVSFGRRAATIVQAVSRVRIIYVWL